MAKEKSTDAQLDTDDAQLDTDDAERAARAAEADAARQEQGDPNEGIRPLRDPIVPATARDVNLGDPNDVRPVAWESQGRDRGYKRLG